MDTKLYKTPQVLKTACLLTEKMYEQGHAVQIVCANPLMMQELDGTLWQFKQLSFIPHMTEEDGEIPASQLVYISTKISKNSPKSAVIIFCDAVAENIPEYAETVIGIFNPDHPDVKKFIDLTLPKKMFSHTDDGRWLEEAS